MSRSPRGFLISFFAALIAILVIGEITFRVWTYWTYAVNGAYTVATRDFPFFARRPYQENEVFGSFPPYASHTLRLYALDGSFARSARISVNNLGWVAFDDYAVKKAPGEFRIAFLGDSLTASVTNNLPWPTVVQRELQKERPGVRVLNLGNPGMNTQRMEKFTLPIAQRLSADMVIVNIPIENLDFPLLPLDWKPKLQGQQLQPLVVGDVQVPVSCPADSHECSVSPAWNVPRGRELSRDEVNRVKRVAARRALHDRLIWTFRPFILNPGGVSQSTSAASAEERIATAVSSLLAIKRAYPNLVVTINTLEWYFDPATSPPLTTTFIDRARTAGLDVIDMRDRLPNAAAEERHRWYNMPVDGHWSDSGAEVYGRAMAALILERLKVAQPADVTAKKVE